MVRSHSCLTDIHDFQEEEDDILTFLPPQQRRRSQTPRRNRIHARCNDPRKETYAAHGWFRGYRFDSYAEDARGLGGQQEGAGGACEEVRGHEEGE